MNTTKEWRQFLLLSTILWMVQASFTTLNTSLIQRYSGNEVRLTAVVIYSYGTALVWLMMMPLILYLTLILRRKFCRWYSILLGQFVLGFGIAVLQRALAIPFLYYLIKWTRAIDEELLSWSNFWGLSYWRQVANGWLIYFVIIGLVYAYLFYLRNQAMTVEKVELQAKMSALQLENLSYQLQPHFLFNSLQSVSTLMHRDLEKADRVLADLGDLLRHSIRNINQQQISLGEELLYLQKYIDLQKTRFGDRLDSQLICDASLLNMEVPAFFLQPVIENSIKHGLESSGAKIAIKISVLIEADQLLFLCQDNGPGRIRSEKSKGNGIGLRNVEERLQHLYGDKAKLSFGPTQDGFITQIQIPLYDETT